MSTSILKNNFFFSTCRFLILILPLLLIIGPAPAEFVIIITSLIGIFFFKEFLLKIKTEKKIRNFFIFFLFFYFLLILSGINSEYYKISLLKSLAYIRFPLFLIGAWILISGVEKKFSENLSKFLVFLFILLLVDGLFQYFFSHNLFGYISSDKSRITSFFRDEEVLGSFVVKFLLLVIFLLNKNTVFGNSINIYVQTFIIFISLILIILSGERSALLYFFIFIFIFFIFIKKIRFLLINLVIIFSLLSIFLSFDPNFKSRVIDRTLVELGVVKKEKIDHDFEVKKIFQKFYLFSGAHQNYFITSYNIFLDNKFFGGGIRTYRILCHNKNYQVNKDSCTTHPHNYYFELLSETGIFSFLLIFFIFIFSFYKILKIFFSKNINKKNKKNFFFYLIIFINFWPIIPTGSFYNNWISMIIYYSLFVTGISYYSFEKK